MPRQNTMWNLRMLQIMNAIEVFCNTKPLSNQNKEEYQMACQLNKEYDWAWKNSPRRFIKYRKGVTP